MPPKVSATVYSGPYFGVTKEGNEFRQFDRRIETVHQEKGYWLFHQSDDAEAYRQGFTKPEQIIVAELRRDGSPKNIQLRWIHGQLDSYRGHRLGTSSEHLGEIAREQALLGLPNLPYLEVPTYPLDPDGKLLQHRQQNSNGLSSEEVQGRTYDKRPRCIHCITSRKDCDRAQPSCGRCSRLGHSCEYPDAQERRLSGYGAACGACRNERKFCDKVRPQCKRCSDHGRSCVYPDSQDHDDPQDVQARLPGATGSTGLSGAEPKPDAYPMHSLCTSPYSAGLNSPFSSGTGPFNTSGYPTPYTPYSFPDSRRSSLGRLSGNDKRSSTGYVSPYAPLPGQSPALRTGNTSPFETAGADDGHSQDGKKDLEQAPYVKQTSASPSVVSLDDPVVLTLTESPNRESQAQSGDISDYLDLPTTAGSFDMTRLMNELEVDSNAVPEIPCMDCGQMEGHPFDCHLGNIKPLVHPTIRQLTLIADAVERFDPERWRENHHPPQSPIEGRATKVKGMAEVIRNEIECMSNARYHTMSDDELVMLWGLKSMKGAQMVFLDGDEPYTLGSGWDEGKEDKIDEGNHDHAADAIDVDEI